MVSVWSEVQICISPSWCHCHSLSLAPDWFYQWFYQNGSAFLMLAYPVCPGKRPLKECSTIYLFNSRFSRTTWVSRYKKGKTFWILRRQEMTGQQWQQLDHMQIIYTPLQTENHAGTWLLSFYRLEALPATQPTMSKHIWLAVCELEYLRTGPNQCHSR